MAKRGPKPKVKDNAEEYVVETQEIEEKTDVKPEVEEIKPKKDRFAELRGLPNRDFYRFSEIAQYLVMSEKTVRDYIAHGHLEKVRHRGMMWIPRYSIIKFVQSDLGVKVRPIW